MLHALARNICAPPPNAQFPKPVLQRALRKQKKKQNERLVRNTLASAAAAAKPEGNSSGSEEDLTVECVLQVFAAPFRLAL